MSTYLLEQRGEVQEIRKTDNLIIAPLRLDLHVDFSNSISRRGGSSLKGIRMENRLIESICGTLEGFQYGKAYIFSKVKCGTIYEAKKNYGPFVMELPENIKDERKEDSEMTLMDSVIGYPIVGSEALSAVPMEDRMNDNLMNEVISSFSYNSLEGNVLVLVNRKLREREIDILNNLGSKVSYLALVTASAFGKKIEERFYEVFEEQILTTEPEHPSEWDLGE